MEEKVKKVTRRKVKSPTGVTLADIGREAGVSISIVSRVLKNRKDRIPEVTREKVREAAERLGYRPNLLIQGVQTGRSMNIGVIIPPSDHHSTQIIQGIQEVLRKAGYCMILTWSPRDTNVTGLEMRRKIVHDLLDRRIDGIIKRPTLTGTSKIYYKEVLKRKIPLVTVGRSLPEVACDFSGTDNELGSRLAVRHLLESGHRHIVHLTEQSDFEPEQLRRKGFDEECASTPGVTFGRVEVAENDRDAAQQAVEKILAAPNRPTAIFLGSDHLIHGCRAAAKQLNLQIPTDISVIGFGNLPESEFSEPALSTIDQDPMEIGRIAARMMLRRIENPEQAPEIHLTQPTLIQRASVATAP
ncbi:MAG: LacI family DNA-binding transcriptional regulator [Luteolibacter sp.]